MIKHYRELKDEDEEGSFDDPQGEGGYQLIFRLQTKPRQNKGCGFEKEIDG